MNDGFNISVLISFDTLGDFLSCLEILVEDVCRISMIIILKLPHYAEIANSASGWLMKKPLVHPPPTSHMWGSDTTVDDHTGWSHTKKTSLQIQPTG